MTDTRWLPSIFVDAPDGTGIGTIVRESTGTLRAIRGVMVEALPFAFLPVVLPGSSVAGKVVRSKIGGLAGRTTGAMVEASALTAMSMTGSHSKSGYARFRLDSPGQAARWITSITPTSDDFAISDATGRPIGRVVLTHATKSLFKREDASCTIDVDAAIDPTTHALVLAMVIAVMADEVAADV